MLTSELTDDEKIKVILKGKEPCKGHAEVLYKGEWGYVGDKNWDKATEETLCRSTDCGKPESHTYVLREMGKPVWLNEVVCNENSSDLTKCTHPGWNSSYYSKDYVKKIHCSKEIEIGFFQGPFKCAGAVMYNTSEGEIGYFCGSLGHKRRQVRGETKNACRGRLKIEKVDKWITDKNSERITPNELCKQIHCGEEGSYNKSTTELTCKKNVEVVLVDRRKPSTCYGEVYFKVDDALKRVCGSNWTKKNAEVVCKELNCGGVVAHLSNDINEQGIMDNVKCSGKEASLWHCMAKRSDHDAFSCSSSAYVVCRGSIDVRLADGPGKCAGRVELLYEGQWQGVTTQEWTKNKNKNADVVCTHLKCGNQAKTERFSQGSGGSLDLSCKPNVSNITDCDITKNQNREAGEKEAVGITCEKHKVVFLKENTCSGTVGIEQAGKTYWLSGSKDTWNQRSADTVCQQMHCGKAVNYSFVPSADMIKDVWRKSYNCSSNSKSLFECKNTQLPSDYNETVASVKCSGDISVKPTEECWGYVNICAGGKCGGVCNAAWTDKMSQMLCAETSCGDAITSVKQKREQSNVIFNSLHMTNHTTSLGQCNLVEKNDRVSCKKAYVVCTGSIKAKINVSSSRSKCSGNVEIHYEGQWLPVCKDALRNAETQKIICRELNCGQPLSVVDYFGPRAAVPPVISKIECPTNGNMSSCSISPGASSCPLGHLQCSSWGHMELKFGDACSGAVFVHSEGEKSGISPNGWSESAGQQLCKDLKCGELRLNKPILSATKSTWHRSFNCDGVETPQNIWDCENSSQNKNRTSAEQVFIECQGEPNVTLSEDCYGEVRINNTSVCHRNWKPEYSDLVCQEKGCGNVVPHSSSSKRESVKDESYHVSCEEYHYKLGQCNRYKAKCEDLVYVYCSGAVKFNTTETCGGKIQVSYGATSKPSYLNLESQDSSTKQKLCEALGCNGHNASIKPPKNKEKQVNFKDTMKAKLNCTKDNMDIRRCVTINDINDQKAKPFQIYCNGYKRSEEPPESGTNYTVAIILGLGFLLIVIILIIVFIRIRMVRKSKRPMNVSSRMLPGKEVESESGEYEPVTNENEMDVFSNGRFRSESEVITENDAKSISYDDVGEAAESQPLTSPTVPAGTSQRDSFFDGVTYEVEDPQENYDDIEASPEFIQTKAEVHDVPEPAPESVTVATPGMVQGEEDYLVPGQDSGQRSFLIHLDLIVVILHFTTRSQAFPPDDKRHPNTLALLRTFGIRFYLHALEHSL
ncbi:Scavenger receptor cysteine-rich type 1 protein M160 CD163 antigen-like 1 [Collichthys lucidus]|uniref:Scavenger receptor cysteine-rich type 1 protein M160 CD163 antigen-like 1 n=1 Tax=Collichthys lucidus TaxID=240159 RepID=A0A4V6APK8_COLLU|nr:Scavenger receptor cysteine-rich type 1 protein M160 CD163 antigen-like 1 [Collichthys lucidus]